MSLRSRLADVAPDRAVEWYRRRRATRRYLSKLGREIYERRGTHPALEDVESDAAGRGGFYGELVKDAAARVDLVLERLHRRIDGVAARDDERLSRLESDLADVRRQLDAIRDTSAPPAAGDA